MKLSKDDVLKQLARKLPDDDLRRLFPDHEPTLVREIIWPLTRKQDAPEPRPAIESSSAGRNLQLFTDGASRGNPGLAGAGFSITDMQGKELRAEGIFLGQCTNNAAEYQALIKGLQAITTLQPDKVDIFLDSQLIVRQVQGQYKVKNKALKPLFAQVKQLLTTIPAWKIHHVPREENKRADELANEGIDLR